jgi:DNA-binding NtrC family response regulator
MSRAARMAGVNRTTLYRLLDKHGIQRRPFSRPWWEAGPGSPT